MNAGLSKINCPKVAVDAIIEMDGRNIILIKRKFPPLGYAFPGGFVDYGESLEDAVKREVKEETNLDFEIKGSIYPRSDPERDPRGHIISIPFFGIGTGIPQAKDDAKEIVIVDKTRVMIDYDLAFDHQEIFLSYVFHSK
jgi:ADP-ribose pyrophosphatase YjhB (NUDIX family)